MIIWHGFGILSGVLFFVGLVIVTYTAEIAKLEQFQDFGSVLPITFLVAAGLNFIMVRYWFDKQKVTNAIDKDTGEEFVISQYHSFFFIPSKYWTYLYIMAFIINMFSAMN